MNEMLTSRPHKSKFQDLHLDHQFVDSLMELKNVFKYISIKIIESKIVVDIYIPFISLLEMTEGVLTIGLAVVVVVFLSLFLINRGFDGIGKADLRTKLGLGPQVSSDSSLSSKQSMRALHFNFCKNIFTP